VAQMSQFEKFQEGNVYEKLHIGIRADELAAVPYKWYNTASTGASTDALSPGIFYLFMNLMTGTSAGNGTAFLVVEGVLEFRGMITPALQFDAPVKPPGKQEAESDDDGVEIFDIAPGLSVGSVVSRVGAQRMVKGAYLGSKTPVKGSKAAV